MAPSTLNTSMAVTREQVLALLESDEPDFAEAADWGAEAAALVEEFARSDDPYLAAGAVYLAGYIPCEHSVAIVAAAVHHPEPETRIASAEAARQLVRSGLTVREMAALRPVFQALLHDSDEGVRRVAQRAAEDAGETGGAAG